MTKSPEPDTADSSSGDQKASGPSASSSGDQKASGPSAPRRKVVRKKRKRRASRVQLCCLIFFFPLFLLILLPPFLPFLLRHGTPIVLSLLLRRPVRLGDVEVDWTRLVLHDFQIDNAPGFAEPRFAAAKRIEIQPDWSALVEGRLRLHSVDLKGPEFRLEMDQERRKNIPRSGRPKKPGGRSAQEIVNLIFQKFEIGSLRLEDGIYTMRLQRQELWLEATGLALELHRAAEGEAYEVTRLDAPKIHLRVGQRLDTRGAIQMRQIRTDAQGAQGGTVVVLLEDGTRVEAEGPRLENYPDPVLTFDPRATVDLQDVTRALRLPLSLEGVAQLVGTLRGPARDLHVEAGLVASQVEAARAGVRLRGRAAQLRGQLDLQGTRLSARDVHFVSFGGDVHLDGEIEMSRENRSLRISLVQSGGELLPTLKELGVPAELTGDWSAIAEIQGTGFDRDSIQGRAVVLVENPPFEPLADLIRPLDAEANPEDSSSAPAAAVLTSGTENEAGLDLQGVLDMASEIAASEALARTERGVEERFAPRPIRQRVLEDLRGRTWPVQGRIDVSMAAGEVFVENARLKLPETEIEAFGRVGFDKSFDLSVQAASEEVGVLAYAMRPYLLFKGIDVHPWTIGQGRGSVRVRLKGSTSDPVVDAQAVILTGLYQRFAFERLETLVHFEDNRAQIQAALTDGKSSMQASGWVLSGPGTKGHLQNLRSPFLSLDWLSSLPDMNLLLETNDYSLPRLADQLGGRLPGSLRVRGKAHLFKEGEKLFAESNLEALADGYLAGQKIEDLEVSAHIEDGQLRLTKFLGSVNGSPIVLKGTASPPARLEMDMDIGPLQLEPLIKLLRLPLPISGTVRVTMTLEGLLPTPVLRFSLTTESLAIAGVPKPPGEVILDLAIRGRELLVQGSFLGDSITLSGSIGLLPPMETSLDLKLQQAQISPLLGLVSASLAAYIDGPLDGQFRLEGPLTNLRLLRMDGAIQTASLQLTEVRVSNEQPVRIVLENGVFEILPVHFSGTGGSFLTRARYQVRGPFELQTEGMANLAIIEAFDSSNAIESITGKAALKVNVRSAPLELPSITGTAEVSEGYLKLTSLVQAIYPIQGTIHLDYPFLVVKEEAPATASFGGGDLKVWGEVIANSSRFEDILLDLRAQGSRISYSYLPEMETIISPNVQVGGTAAVPLVSGKLVLDRVRYKDRIELKAMLVRTAEQTTGALLSQKTTLSAEEVAPTTIDPVLDLQVSLPNSIRIDSKGVDLRITSPGLRVVGTYLRMGILGTLDIEEDGKISYEDREFTVKSGNIEFLDPTRLDPSINLELEGEIGEHDININVTGSAENPTTQFTSNPPLSELDILTIILGGDPNAYVIDPVTGTEEQRSRSAEQLVGAAATALDLDDAVFQRVGNILAADRFLVDPVITESGFQGARITWGKNVGRLDIVASQLLPATEPPLVLFKYRLSDHIFIEGRNKGGNLDETDVDLKFRWDFR